MACFSPTMATKRAMRSAASDLAGDLGGVSTMFITWARSCRERPKNIALPAGDFLPHERGAAARARREVERHRRARGAVRRRRPEGEQRLARLDIVGVEPQPRPRRVVRSELPR